MVIAELLNQIKDLEKSRRLLNTKLRDNVFILPDLAADEKPQTLEEMLGELQSTVIQIADAKTKLISMNVSTRAEITLIGGATASVTLMEAIKKIETYRNFESLYNDLAALMSSKGARYFTRGGYGASGEPVKLSPNFTPTTGKEMLKKSKEYRDAARKIEQLVVKTNWSTEVV